MSIQDPATLASWDLPQGITSRFVDTSPIGLKFHVLEALPQSSSALNDADGLPPLILLLHGFPNLSYDWRFVMPKLAEAGYYAVAFDQRGFGRSHNADLSPLKDDTFRPLTAVRDVIALVNALGYTSVRTLVGHDLGAFIASVTSLVRPDMIQSLVLLAHPWGGVPGLPLGKGTNASFKSSIQPREVPEWGRTRDPDIQASLVRLDPPRVPYKWYNASETAAKEWTYETGQPLRDFLRGYFHVKSGAYTRNRPRRLKSWTADELAVMPHYYTMQAGLTVRENIRLDMEGEPKSVLDALSQTPWLTGKDLTVYEEEFTRNTFHDALLWYRTLTDPTKKAELLPLAGKKISIPMKHVSGASDWGTYQVPGALEACEQGICVEKECWMGHVELEGAGHWPNMEKPKETADEILKTAALVK